MSIRKFLPVLLVSLTWLLSGCSEHTAATAKLANEVATVGIQVKGAQRTLRVGEQTVLPISIANNGVASIPSSGKPDGSLKVFATYHWLRPNGEIALWDGIRTSLPEDIRSGKALDVQLTLKAPAVPGPHILVIDLVQEGALWFAETGSQTARMNYSIVQ
jgi:hypothetical protein